MTEGREVDFYCYCRCGCLTIIPISDRYVAGHGPVVVTGAGDAPPPMDAQSADTNPQLVSGASRVAVTGPGQGARTAFARPGADTGRPPFSGPAPRGGDQ